MGYVTGNKEKEKSVKLVTKPQIYSLCATISCLNISTTNAQNLRCSRYTSCSQEKFFTIYTVYTVILKVK